MTQHTKRAFIAGLAALAATSAVPALAQNKTTGTQFVRVPTFAAEDQARIKRATAYLQALSAASGRFEQTDFRGRVTAGQWWLQRPGKIRFEYDAPYSLLVVADGKNVNMWDPRLKSFDKYPLGVTPLSLFLSKQIRLDQGVIVTEVTRTTDGFRLKARDRRKDVEGAIIMTFRDQGGRLTLGDWTVIDAQGKSTRVNLVTLNTAASLKPSLFVLNKPETAQN